MQTENAPTTAQMPRRVLLIALLASAFLYTWRLGDAPVYLGGDEAHFAVHAKAIATDGRNLDGMFLPLFVNLWDPQGDQLPHDLKSALVPTDALLSDGAGAPSATAHRDDAAPADRA